MSQGAETPPVSVLMPAYNSEATIERALCSILRQSYENLQVLVHDDGSTDETFDRARSINDKRVSVSRTEANQGYVKSINSLLLKARGDLITFQDSDDVSLASRIEAQVNWLNENRHAELCGTQCRYIWPSGHCFDSRFPTTHRELLLELCRGETKLFCGSSVMFRRRLIETNGTFRDFFDRIGGEDLDWLFRALVNNLGGNLPDVLYMYNQRSGSLSNVFNAELISEYSSRFALAAFYLERDGQTSQVKKAFSRSEASAFINNLRKRRRFIWQPGRAFELGFSSRISDLKGILRFSDAELANLGIVGSIEFLLGLFASLLVPDLLVSFLKRRRNKEFAISFQKHLLTKVIEDSIGFENGRDL